MLKEHSNALQKENDDIQQKINMILAERAEQKPYAKQVINKPCRDPLIYKVYYCTLLFSFTAEDCFSESRFKELQYTKFITKGPKGPI